MIGKSEEKMIDQCYFGFSERVFIAGNVEGYK